MAFVTATNLATLLLGSTSSEIGRLAQRCKARLQISKHHGEFEKVLDSGNFVNAGLEENALNSLDAAIYLAAFGGKVIVVTHKGNSLREQVKPDSKGELTCINRSFPNGHSTYLPAICYDDGSLQYLKATTNLDVTRELLLVALDEGQTDLPREPTWVRVGRYELIDNLPQAENIELYESIEGGGPPQVNQSTGSLKIELTLLPMWKTGDMIIVKALVQLEGQPLISKAKLANYIRERIDLMKMIGNSLTGVQAHELNNSKVQLELYLEIVEAKTEEFTKESLKNVVDRYEWIIMMFGLFFREKIDLSTFLPWIRAVVL